MFCAWMITTTLNSLFFVKKNKQTMATTKMLIDDDNIDLEDDQFNKIRLSLGPIKQIAFPTNTTESQGSEKKSIIANC